MGIFQESRYVVRQLQAFRRSLTGQSRDGCHLVQAADGRPAIVLRLLKLGGALESNCLVESPEGTMKRELSCLRIPHRGE